jgi:hypothetical protein
MNGVDRSL